MFGLGKYEIVVKGMRNMEKTTVKLKIVEIKERKVVIPVSNQLVSDCGSSPSIASISFAS